VIAENVLLDEDLIPVDRLGRKDLHQFNILAWCKAMPGFASQFQTVVPPRFYTGNKKTCTVTCPCGAVEEFKLGLLFTCPNCTRIYLWLGDELRVANSPTPGGEVTDIG
jgi:hypothetical protein